MADQDVCNNYAVLMKEAKLRLDAVWNAVHGKIAEEILPPPLVAEFCYLQLRMTCELIALGCLVAHEDMPTTKSKDMQKIWEAGKIMSALTGLHAGFYPRPATREKLSDGQWLVKPRADGFATKDELTALVGRLGDVLHRGTLKKLFADNAPDPIGFDQIHDYAQRIGNLLNMHYLTRVDGKTYIFCMIGLKDPDKPGKVVQVAISKSMTDVPPSVAEVPIEG